MSDIRALKRIHRMGPFLAYFFEYARGTIRDTPSFQMVRPGVATELPNDPVFRSNHPEPLLTRNSMHFITEGAFRLITPAGQTIEYSMTSYPTGRQLREGFYTQLFTINTKFVCVLPIIVDKVYYRRQVRVIRARERFDTNHEYLFTAQGATTALVPAEKMEAKRGIVLYTGASRLVALRDTLVLETSPEGWP